MSGNAWTWGTKDKFGQVFGVPITKGEQRMMEAARDRLRTPGGRAIHAFKAGIAQRARYRPVTKVKLSFLEEDK